MARHDKHIPDEKKRKTVLDLASCGVPMVRIADYMGICEDTLRTHYKREIAEAKCLPIAQAGRTLFDIAVTDRDVNALKFYLGTQGGWRSADKEAEKETKSVIEQLIEKL